MKLNAKSFYIATGIVVVMGAAGIYLINQDLEATKSKVTVLKTEARDKKEVEAELAKTRTEITGLRTKLRHLEQGVPSFAYIPTMARELEHTGRSYGIDVLGVRPIPKPKEESKDGEKKQRKTYEELTINVKGRGSYGSVKRFVQALTRFPKIVEVRMLTLTPKIDGAHPNAAPLLDAEIEMRAYAFKDTAPAADVKRVALKGDEVPNG